MIYEFAATPHTFGAGAMQAASGNHQALLAFLQGVAFNGVLANLGDGAWKGESARQLAGCPWPNRNGLISALELLD